MPPSIAVVHHAVIHHTVIHHTVIHSGGGIGIQGFGELDVGEADILDGLDGDGEAVLRLAGHEGVFGVSTGDHAAVVVVHGDDGGNGGHAVLAGGGHGYALHDAHVGRAVLVDVHHHTGLDVAGVALVHLDFDDHLGGVGDGDALAAGHLLALGQAALENRAVNGGDGVVLLQLLGGLLQLLLGGLEGVLLGGDLLVGVLGAQLHQELPGLHVAVVAG